MSLAPINPASTASVHITYGYDNDGLLTSANAPGAAMSLTRDAQNGLLAATTVGTVTDARTYNPFAEPIGYTAKVSGTAIDTTTYTRDKLGRITQKVETIQGTTRTYDYVYDAAGRLQSVTRDGAPLASWTWDADGNRLSATTTAGTINCAYDAQDRLTGCGNVTYTWNASGQLETRSDSASGTTTHYHYDMFGNLRHVTLADGTNIDYLIDGLNRRIGKKVNGTLVRGLLYQDGLRPVAQLDGAGNIVSIFVYADRANVPSYLLQGGHVYRIIADQLGSPRLVIDVADGSVAERIDYDAWGNVLRDTNPGFQPFGFAGGLLDADTGLVRFGARDYDLQTGRWTTKDPIGFNGGDTNLYTYVADDPTTQTDPSGLWTFQIGFSVSWTWGPLSMNAFVGAAIDNNGNIAPYYGSGFGASAGLGASGGVQLALSNADTICQLRKTFVNASAGAGEGIGASVDGFWGGDASTPTSGVGLTIGPALGASAADGVTYTYLGNVGHLW